MVINERSIHRYLIFSIILVLILGLFADILDIDSARYASISLELLKNEDWLQIQHRNTPFTDLPPLFFWLNTLSFKLFGPSNASYKFFGVLAAFLGIYSTFQLTKIYYGQRAARIAAIILGTTQGLFALTLNSRTDTLLLSAIIFSIWQIVEYLRSHQIKNFLLGSIGIAFAMLAQGAIGLLIPALTIGIDLVLRQKWKKHFKWKWVLGSLAIIAFFISPMIFGLSEQLRQIGSDKSSIYFFFTTQSFGRLTNGRTNNFIYLWAFIPWGIVSILAFVDKIKAMSVPKTISDQRERTKDRQTTWLAKNTKKYPEHISTIGLIITFTFLITSRHHLPHSIFLLAPFSAIFTAAYIDKLNAKTLEILYKSQAILIFALWMLSFLLLFYIFTPANLFVAIICTLMFAMTIGSLYKLPQKKALVVSTSLWALGFAFIQSNHLYPRLSSYQSGVYVGKWLKEHPEESAKFFNFGILSDTEGFYGNKIIDIKKQIIQLSSKDRFLYTDEIGINKMKQATIPYVILKEFDDFDGKLNLTFLNPKTRAKVLEKRYLIAIYPKGK